MIEKIRYGLWIIGVIFLFIFFFSGHNLVYGWLWCGFVWAGNLTYVFERIKERKEKKNE